MSSTLNYSQCRGFFCDEDVGSSEWRGRKFFEQVKRDSLSVKTRKCRSAIVLFVASANPRLFMVAR